MKIGDFGISNRVGRTYTTTDEGTPEYVAPEIWEGQEFKYEPDIFALGCIFHEILLQKLPFPIKTDIQELSTRILQDPFDSSELHRCPYASIAPLVEKMLTKERKERIQINQVLSMCIIYIYIYILYSGNQQAIFYFCTIAV